MEDVGVEEVDVKGVDEKGVGEKGWARRDGLEGGREATEELILDSQI